MIRLTPTKFFTVIILTFAGAALLLIAALFLLRQPAYGVRLAAVNSETLITPTAPTLVQNRAVVPPLLTTQTSVATNAASANLIILPEPSLSADEPSQIVRPLFEPNLPLLTGPVDVPLELHIPALDITAPVLGVGLTLTNAMAAPVGIRADDPIWQSVFWYRGGGIPGEVGTATFAGHFDDADGLPAVFAFLSDLRVDDLIIVRNTRSGLDVHFMVTETRTYTNQEANDLAVLSRVFGSSSVSGAEVRPTSDGLSHLTLITCTGTWIDESFDLRLVVYATRVN